MVDRLIHGKPIVSAPSIVYSKSQISKNPVFRRCVELVLGTDFHTKYEKLVDVLQKTADGSRLP
jgi:hypothetical protein